MRRRRWVIEWNGESHGPLTRRWARGTFAHMTRISLRLGLPLPTMKRCAASAARAAVECSECGLIQCSPSRPASVVASEDVPALLAPSQPSKPGVNALVALGNVLNEKMTPQQVLAAAFYPQTTGLTADTCETQANEWAEMALAALDYCDYDVVKAEQVGWLHEGSYTPQPHFDALDAAVVQCDRDAGTSEPVYRLVRSEGES